MSNAYKTKLVGGGKAMHSDVMFDLKVLTRVRQAYTTYTAHL